MQPLLRICTGTGGIPWSECILLWWAVLICAHRLWFHPSELDNYRSLCSEPWSLLWRTFRLRRGNKGKHSRGVDSCWCLQSARMADGFLIDFLVLSQFVITTSPTLCQRCAAVDLSFWTRASQILTRRGLVYSCA